MPAAGTLGVKRVNGAALERLDRVLDEARLIERVGVDHHLHVVVVGNRQAAVDRRRRRAPIFVQLERAGATSDHLLERRRTRRIAFAGETEVDRQCVGGLDHAADVPRSRRARGGEGAMRRTGAAAEHGGDAGHQRLLHLLRADEVNVRIEAAGGEDLAFTGDHFGAGSDDDRDVGLNVGIAGLADRCDAAAGEPDVGLDDSPMVEDQRVGDDGVDRALLVGDLALPHAVTDHLAAAELHLFAIGTKVLFHFDDDVGIGKPHAVARGGSKHLGIGGALHLGGHASSCEALAASRSELSHHLLAKAVDRALAGERDERDFARLSRLEPHCRTGSDV